MMDISLWAEAEWIAAIAVLVLIVFLAIGALSPPLAEQLAKQGLRFKSADEARNHQKSADAIVRLRVHRLLTDRESQAAQQRLMQQVLQDVEPEK